MNQIIIIAINGQMSEKAHTTNYAEMSDSQITQKYNKMLSCIRDKKCDLKKQLKLEEFQMVVRRVCIVRNARENNKTGMDIYNQIESILRNTGSYKFTLSWKTVNKPVKKTENKVVKPRKQVLATT